jgi:hypothetical protein
MNLFNIKKIIKGLILITFLIIYGLFFSHLLLHKNIEKTFLFFKKKRKLFLDFKMIFQSSFKFLKLQNIAIFSF